MYRCGTDRDIRVIPIVRGIINSSKGNLSKSPWKDVYKKISTTEVGLIGPFQSVITVNWGVARCDDLDEGHRIPYRSIAITCLVG
jgi:hypothetical protein